MYASNVTPMSVDSLSPTTSSGTRGDFALHSKPAPSPHRPGSRRNSTTSSIHSVGGALDTSSTSWANAVLELGQNAISTLLQPPIVRTGLLPHTMAPASSAHKPPTSRDIPPVPLTNVPHVDASEFTTYLSQIGPVHEQLRRIREDEDEGPYAWSPSGNKASDLTQLLDDSYLKPGKRAASLSRRVSSASLASMASLERAEPTRRSGSNHKRSTVQGPPPLSTIPAVYFDEDFHLENPRTFDVVSERSDVFRPVTRNGEKGANGHAAAPPRKALATNAILQEKLSWYMDTVERHLIQSISTASTTFFTALGSLRELHSEAATSVDKIKALRKELEALDDEIATRGLTLTHRRRRRENLQQLYDAVMQLRDVVEGVAVCESLVDSGQLDQALDTMDDLEGLIAGERARDHGPPRQLRDLRGAVALQGVRSDLDSLRFRIGKAYETHFVGVMMGDLRRHVASVSHREVLMRWTSASARARGGHGREPSAFPSYLAAIDGLRAVLLSCLTGLQRANFLTAATTVYREAVLKEMRSIIRRPLPSMNEDDNESIRSSSTTTGGRQRSQQERSYTLARNLRALEPKDVEVLLEQMYIGITETLRRLDTQVKTLLDVAYSIGDTSPTARAGMKSPPLKSPPFSPTSSQACASAALDAQEEIHRALDLPNLVGQGVDVAQDKIVKLLRVRSEQTRHLSLARFLRYFMLNLHFANECEAISGRSGTVLKNVVNGHIKDFVQSHGDAQVQKLAQGMDADAWNAVDFTPQDAELLARILESSTRDAPAWLESAEIYLPYSDDVDMDKTTDTNGLGHGQAAPGAGKTKTRSAIIESESFVLPNSAVLCMQGIAQFLHLITAIPSMTADVSTSLIAYLKMFNSRCTQLILGAGATRSAGLKNINARNLSLASQALAFIATLIPHIREFVRRHSTSSGPGLANTMGEFDKVRRLYQEHQNSIYDKLVEIMSARASAGAKKMKDVGWDEADAPGGGGANGEDDERAAHDYMRTVTKETTQLHRALTKNLPESAVRLIMLPVFTAYKNTFGEAFKAAKPQTEAGRDSMIHDVDFFSARLGKMEGFGDTGDYLTGVIKAKEINGLARDATGQQGDSVFPPEEEQSKDKTSSELGVKKEMMEEEAATGDRTAPEHNGSEGVEEETTTTTTTTTTT